MAAREIGAKANEIPEFQPLLEQIDDVELRDAVVIVDALHAQRAYAQHLVTEREAHYLLIVKNDWRTLAAQPQPRPQPSWSLWATSSAAPCAVGWVNTAGARRAHTAPDILTLHGIT